MGYDVSFHPISPEEMRKWYFTPLTWIQQGQEEKALALAAQHGMEDFYAEKYLDTLRVGAETPGLPAKQRSSLGSGPAGPENFGYFPSLESSPPAGGTSPKTKQRFRPAGRVSF